jgi:hypothetical protein
MGAAHRRAVLVGSVVLAGLIFVSAAAAQGGLGRGGYQPNPGVNPRSGGPPAGGPGFQPGQGPNPNAQPPAQPGFQPDAQQGVQQNRGVNPNPGGGSTTGYRTYTYGGGFGIVAGLIAVVIRYMRWRLRDD